jgi:NADH-quinone oxidoreductase subunit F
VVEIPFGVTLRSLVEEICGGIPNGRTLKVMHPAGGMLGLIPANLIDKPIEFDALGLVIIEPDRFPEPFDLHGSPQRI